MLGGSERVQALEKAVNEGKFDDVTALQVRVLGTRGMQFAVESQIRMRVGFGKQSVHLNSDQNINFNQAVYFPCNSFKERSLDLMFDIYDSVHNNKLGIALVDLKPVLFDKLKFVQTIDFQTSVNTTQLNPRNKPGVEIEVQFSRHVLNKPTVRKVNATAEAVTSAVPTWKLKSLQFELLRIVNFKCSEIAEAVKLSVSIVNPKKPKTGQELSHEGFFSGDNPAVNGKVHMNYWGDDYIRFRLTRPQDGAVIAKCKFNLERHVLATPSRTFSGFLYMTPEANFAKYLSGQQVKIHIRGLCFNTERAKPASFMINVEGKNLEYDPKTGNLTAVATNLVDKNLAIIIDGNKQHPSIIDLCDKEDDGGMMASFFMEAPRVAADNKYKHAQPVNIGISADVKEVIENNNLLRVDSWILNELKKPIEPEINLLTEVDEVYSQVGSDNGKALQLTFLSFPMQLRKLPASAELRISTGGKENSASISIGKLCSNSTARVYLPNVKQVFLEVINGEVYASGSLLVKGQSQKRATCLLNLQKDESEFCDLDISYKTTDSTKPKFHIIMREDVVKEELVTDKLVEGDVSLQVQKEIFKIAGDFNVARDDMANQGSFPFSEVGVHLEDSSINMQDYDVYFNYQDDILSLANTQTDLARFSSHGKWLIAAVTKKKSSKLHGFALIDVEAVGQSVKLNNGCATQLKLPLFQPTTKESIVALATSTLDGPDIIAPMIDSKDTDKSTPVEVTAQKMNQLTVTMAGPNYKETLNQFTMNRTVISGADGAIIETGNISEAPNSLSLKIVGFEGIDTTIGNNVTTDLTFQLMMGPPKKRNIKFGDLPFEDVFSRDDGLKTLVTFPKWLSSGTKQFFKVNSENKVLEIDLSEHKGISFPLVNRHGVNVVNKLKDVQILSFYKSKTNPKLDREYGTGYLANITELIREPGVTGTKSIELISKTKEIANGVISIEFKFFYDPVIAKTEKKQAVKL